MFSNYESVHRVLKMEFPAGNQDMACRDFLALFIVDQRAPLASTSHYIPRQVDEQEEVRKKLFVDQIKPAGRFGGNREDMLYNTGNGDPLLIGWVEKFLRNDLMEHYEEAIDCIGDHLDLTGLQTISALNFAPPLGRGISWAFEADSWINLDPDVVLKEYEEKPTL